MMDLKKIMVFFALLSVSCGETSVREPVIDVGFDVPTSDQSDCLDDPLQFEKLIGLQITDNPSGPLKVDYGYLVFRNGEWVTHTPIDPPGYVNEFRRPGMISYDSGPGSILAMYQSDNGLRIEQLARSTPPPGGPQPTFGQPITLADGGTEPTFGVHIGRVTAAAFTHTGVPTVFVRGLDPPEIVAYPFPSAHIMLHGNSVESFAAVAVGDKTDFYALTTDPNEAVKIGTAAVGLNAWHGPAASTSSHTYEVSIVSNCVADCVTLTEIADVPTNHSVQTDDGLFLTRDAEFWRHESCAKPATFKSEVIASVAHENRIFVLTKDGLFESTEL